jgi:THO complex subunit 4
LRTEQKDNTNYIQDLFNRIGPVQKLELLYDRQDRSRGIAFVTYESYHDAKRAIREYDGANANGTTPNSFQSLCY